MGNKFDRLKDASNDCHRCALYKRATQTVFGKGSLRAHLMLVGEQPGNAEDLQGEPFVGPAGGMLNEILELIGIPLETVYITNAVKHFKWKPQGKIRLHQKPNAAELKACRIWLESEISLIKPRMIVCLGVTALQSMLGSRLISIAKARGQVFFNQQFGCEIVATWHPSAILRSPDPQSREIKKRELFEDLSKAWKRIHK